MDDPIGAPFNMLAHEIEQQDHWLTGDRPVAAVTVYFENRRERRAFMRVVRDAMKKRGRFKVGGIKPK